MDENKQFDNNGTEIPVPPKPTPARYRHEPEHDITGHCHPPAHPHGHHAGRCAGKEDAFVLRIKWKHIKLAALLLVAFMLGSLVTKIEYNNKFNLSNNSWSCITETFNIHNSKDRTMSTPNIRAYNIEEPVPVTEFYSGSQYHYIMPDYDYESALNNSNQRNVYPKSNYKQYYK